MSDLHSIEAEQALLGAILIKNGVYDRLSFLKAEDFYDPLHVKTYSLIGSLVSQDRTVTPAVLTSLIKEENTGDFEAGAYFGRLVKEAVIDNLATEYARTVLDYSCRRKVAALMGDVAGLNASVQTPLDQSLSSLITGVDDILLNLKQTAHRTGHAGHEINEAILDLDRASPPALSTGIRALDDKIDGYDAGEFIVIGARPGMGKTTVAIQQALSICKKGKGVAFFSLEMSGKQIVRRALAAETSLRYERTTLNQIKTKQVSKSQRENLFKTSESLFLMPFYIDDSSSLTVSQIGSRARQIRSEMAKEGVTLGAIFVDHLILVKPSGNYKNNKTAEVGEISNGLRCIAREMGVPVIALCQLNRAVEGKEDKRPTLADLRYSGDIEQDAHKVIFIYRDAYYLAMEAQKSGEAGLEARANLAHVENVIEFLVAKNRDGQMGAVEAFCDMAICEVRDI